MALERFELAAQAVELGALGLDEVRGRLRDEALVGELRLGAGDLAAQPLALGLGLARLRLAVDELARANLDAAAGDADRGRRVAMAGEVQTGHARHEVGGAIEPVD